MTERVLCSIQLEVCGEELQSQGEGGGEKKDRVDMILTFLENHQIGLGPEMLVHSWY